MTSLSADGVETLRTPHHHFALPPHIPGRYQPQFDGYGRYKLPHPSTGKVQGWTRATTLTKVLEDTYNIDRWRTRMMLKGLEEQLHIQANLTQALEEDPDNKKRLDALAEDARVAGGAALASEFGTAVHGWLEYVDNGLILPTQVPDEYQDHAKWYLSKLAGHALTPLPQYTERIVLNTHAGAVGTLDRIYQMADGQLVMGDVKTSKGLDFSWMAYAIQLVIYRDADYMLSLDGTTWEPMPQLNDKFAVLMHCPSDNPSATAAVTYDLAFGRLALDAALLVRQLREQAPKKVPYLHALPSPSALQAAQQAAVLDLRLARTDADLAKVWEENQAIWTDGLTQLGASVSQSLHVGSSRT